MGGITQDGAPDATRHALAASIKRTSRRLFRMSRDWGRNDNHPMPIVPGINSKIPAPRLSLPDHPGGNEGRPASVVANACGCPAYIGVFKDGNGAFSLTSHGEA